MGEHCRIRVQKKLKVRLNVTVILYVYLCYEGGARARPAYGACPRTQPAIFTRVLVADERSDEGEGDTGN